MDPTQFRDRFKRWREGFQVYKNGRPIDDEEFESFRQTLPDNQKPIGDYRTRRYWELNDKPKTFSEAIGKGMYTLGSSGKYGQYGIEIPSWHANSVAYDAATGNYEFMKPNSHPTRWMEDVYGYWGPDNLDFRENYKLEKGAVYDKYVPKKNVWNLPKFDDGKDSYRYYQDGQGGWFRAANDDMTRAFEGLVVTPRKTKYTYVPKKIDNSEQAVKWRDEYNATRNPFTGLPTNQGLEIVSPEADLIGLAPLLNRGLLMPTMRFGKPIYNATSKLVANGVDKVKWLYNEGNVFNAPMKYNPENFYRLVGQDAIEDANLTGVIRANPNSNFKVPFFGYKRINPSTKASKYDSRLIIEGSPNSAETWADSWRYDSRRSFIKDNLDNLTYELKIAESPKTAGLYTDEEIQALHRQRAFWNDLFKNKYRDVRETPTTSPLSTQYFEEVSKNRPGWMMEFGTEAFPSNAGSTIVPNDNFIYWQKYPLLGWRPNSFKTASGSRSALPRVSISIPKTTAK